MVKYLTDGTLVRDCKSKLKALEKWSRFLDSKGVVRIGGRFQRSSYDYNVKHPVLLPKRSNLTRLIVVFYHKVCDIPVTAEFLIRFVKIFGLQMVFQPLGSTRKIACFVIFVGRERVNS